MLRDLALGQGAEDGQNAKHTAGGILRRSPTLILVARFSAYVWQSGRVAQRSSVPDCCQILEPGSAMPHIAQLCELYSTSSLLFTNLD